MNEPKGRAFPPAASLGLPLEQALLVCREAGMEPLVVMTGRQDREDASPRVIGLRPGTLVAALLRDGDPRKE